MAEIDWAKAASTAHKVAKDLASKWPIVEADDVAQEILKHALEQRALFEQKAGEDGFEEFFRKAAWRTAKAYAAREQNTRDTEDGQYYYTPEEARNALKSLVYTDAEISELIGKKDDLGRCRITDNITSARMDAERGLKRLNDRYREALTRIYVLGIPARDHAERLVANRAADALAIAMNGHIRATTRAGAR
ncbi:hypothetical protein ACIRBX_11835 [Kitasatospora sp. NPDC096147]|uniref:hypothetical protein n=1 Tax=Kitasatospora sp. NPDC096147 TaxID=3364093 RepID=UPI0037FC2B9B